MRLTTGCDSLSVLASVTTPCTQGMWCKLHGCMYACPAMKAVGREEGGAPHACNLTTAIHHTAVRLAPDFSAPTSGCAYLGRPGL
jgi:hypothetical protein